MQSPEEIIEDEWYLVRYSGEIPEIALNSSFYFLTRDKNGPGIELSEEQVLRFTSAAQDRFHEIILRDMIPENRDKTIYRGIRRSIANWERYQQFCGRHDLDADEFKHQVAEHLLHFLDVHQAEVCSGDDCPLLDCTYDELIQFIQALGLGADDLPENVRLGHDE